MWCTQNECVVRKTVCCLLLWLLWCGGGSTVELREDEQHIVVVLLVVVFSVVYVLAVTSCHVRCLIARWQLDCCVCGGEGRGSCWLFESAAYEVTFHRVSFRAVLHRGDPDRVAREIVVVSVGSG